MRVLVTGGAGFIGANLCRALVAEPTVDAVVALDDLSTGREDNLAGIAGRVAFVRGSVLQDELLGELVAEADAVVHLAALPSVPRSVADPLGAHDANATGTLRVLDAARRAGGPLTVIASSSSVYGDSATMPKHEGLVPRPLSPYAASKLAGESYARAYAASYGQPVLPLRFFNVFGRLQRATHAYAAVIPAFIAAALAERPATIHGDGTQTRDFTFVAGVCEVLVCALRDHVTSPEPVNLAFGTRTSLLEVLALLEDILGHPIERAHTAPRPGDVRHSQADRTRLDRLFPQLAARDFRADLKDTADWFATTRDRGPAVMRAQR